MHLDNVPNPRSADRSKLPTTQPGDLRIDPPRLCAASLSFLHGSAPLIDRDRGRRRRGRRPTLGFLWFCSVVTGLVLALALVTVAGAW
ncbi:hypothetical protein [Cellulomonas fengjieae]|uniref:Uncharacterized protein n=1 Tax=Cellulomonas fengjieae TaxID=2819978 RepID=A0ABS3SK36_9CELL|nr:hypothetical protein [Cellulomonas fengjieae]MBO3086027.1 hypothetical protein [Cellulomonas fengjieae]QVI65904.1 hypothetical protein KG102_17825 [Cellulomonas fengjieae]